jgi:hypothetical protein
VSISINFVGKLVGNDFWDRGDARKSKKEMVGTWGLEPQTSTVSR